MAARIERVPRVTAAGAPGLLWVMRQPRNPEPRGCLYLHGNGANVSTPENVERYQHLHGLGLQVVAPEYPGFGEVAGAPSEAALVAAARDAWNWLRDSGVPASVDRDLRLVARVGRRDRSREHGGRARGSCSKVPSRASTIGPASCIRGSPSG